MHVMALIPLDFCGEKALNADEVGIAAYPCDVDLAPVLVAASAEAFTFDGGGGDRTRNLRIQSALLFPVELHPQGGI